MSIGTVALGVVVLVGSVFAGFWLLHRISDRTYRPTPQKMAEALRKLTEDDLSWSGLDELSCVRIAYDRRLDQIRERLNSALDQPGSFEQSSGESSNVRLTEAARARVGELIRELETLAT